MIRLGKDTDAYSSKDEAQAELKSLHSDTKVMIKNPFWPKIKNLVLPSLKPFLAQFVTSDPMGHFFVFAFLLMV